MRKRIRIFKQDSLNTRAKKLGLAIDMFFMNRAQRRDGLKTAVREERKANKNK